MTPLRPAALLALVAAAGLALLSPASAAPSGDVSRPCAETATTTVANRTVITCERFHSGTAVRLPADSATIAYGILVNDFGTVTGVTTRDGRTLPLASGTDASGLEQVAAQAYVRAHVTAGKVTSVTPYLIVSQRAVVTAYAGSTLRGKVTLMVGSGSMQRTAIQFAGATLADGTLPGRILNYRRSATVGRATLDPLVNPTTRAVYRPIFGSSAVVSLSWNPAMHTPTDSEIVMTGSVAPSYMTQGPQLADLMTGAWAPTAMDFVIHGTPIGTPSRIEGRLVR